MPWAKRILPKAALLPFYLNITFSSNLDKSRSLKPSGLFLFDFLFFLFIFFWISSIKIGLPVSNGKPYFIFNLR